MYYNCIISNTSKHIGELRDAIAQDVLPSKTQCEELIGDLDNMQRLISERNFIMQHSIEELYGDFSGCSDKIKSCLNNMSDMISTGKVPDTEVVDEFVNSVAELREKYSYVYQSALLQLPSFEMPEDGAGAGEYAYAVKNSKTLILRKKVKETAECLNMFYPCGQILKSVHPQSLLIKRKPERFSNIFPNTESKILNR